METDDQGRIRARLLVAAVLGVAMASLLVAVPGLRGVLRQIAHARPAYLVAAIALELGSCVSFVVVFRLFFSRLPGAGARRLAWIEEGSGALLPGGGVGALAVGGWLLHRAGMSTSAILRRSSALFLLTSATSVTVLVAAGLLLLTGAASGPHDLLRTAVPTLGAAGAAIAVLAWGRRTGRSNEGRVHDLGAGVGEALRALAKPHWRLLGALGYLGFDISVLWATFAAVGRPLPGAALIVAYILGYLANLIPVPGGVGVLEGGLGGALVAYGAHATQAAAAVVVYHAIAFWIPSLGGLLAYWLLRRDLATQPEVVSADPSQTHRRPADAVGEPRPLHRRARAGHHRRRGTPGPGVAARLATGECGGRQAPASAIETNATVSER